MELHASAALLARCFCRIGCQREGRRERGRDGEGQRERECERERERHREGEGQMMGGRECTRLSVTLGAGVRGAQGACANRAGGMLTNHGTCGICSAQLSVSEMPRPDL